MARLVLESARYSAADTLLGGRDSRRIGHNTTLHRSGPDIAVRYHATDILTMAADGTLSVDTAGWHTVTTWQRVNALLPAPWHVRSDRGRVMVWHRSTAVTPFVDGIVLHPDSDDVAVSYAGDPILTYADIAAIRAAAEAAAERRDTLRAARLLREHPTAGIPHAHKVRSYDGRPHGCERCDTERAAEYAARMAALAAEHAAMVADGYAAGSTMAALSSRAVEAFSVAYGGHVTIERRMEWPTGADGRTDYRAAPIQLPPSARFSCPWSCPNHSGGY